MASTLEKRFKMVWRSVHGQTLVEEHRFHPVRKWRADFAHLDSRTLIEVEGGIHSYGRHNRASGFIADAEKYLEAGLLGWRVFRLVSDQITPENLQRIKRFIDQHSTAEDEMMGMLN
jgi:very-short-patch-repair endonuclease